MASTSAKTRRALAENAARFDPDAVEPIVLKPRNEPVEKIHLFTLYDENDEPTEFHIPKKVKFNVTLKATEIFAQLGEVAATAYMLRALLGDEGYDALVNYDDLEQEDFEAICDVASKIVMGDKDAKGKAR